MKTLVPPRLAKSLVAIHRDDERIATRGTSFPSGPMCVELSPRRRRYKSLQSNNHEDGDRKPISRPMGSCSRQLNMPGLPQETCKPDMSGELHGPLNTSALRPIHLLPGIEFLIVSRIFLRISVIICAVVTTRLDSSCPE